jgi:hypothetical protein
MNKVREIIKEISFEKIGIHIRNLEGIRHPFFAPDALERAGDYIWKTLQSFRLEMSWHHFNEDDKQYK